MTESKSLAF